MPLRSDHPLETPSIDEQRAQGKAARQTTPRSAQGVYEAPAGRDPLGIIEEQNESRYQDLVPLRMARMSTDPFAFYRGTAALQAADLASSVDSGHFVVAVGDAHLSNFGVFAAADRRVIFDLNDFDEAAPAPWEWDVKRLVTSMLIAARSNGIGEKKRRTIAEACARAYRRGIQRAIQGSALERYYFRIEAVAGDNLSKSSRKALQHTLKAANKRTSARVAKKIMAPASDGRQRIREKPPTMTHVPAQLEDQAAHVIEGYRQVTSPDIHLLLTQYTLTDVARRVVGVGSVGTRCYIAVLTGPSGEPLILQMKEAGESVLQQYGGTAHRTPQAFPLSTAEEGGQRVVTFQRILQASSDPFLGYVRGPERGFYLRQFRDFNASFEIKDLSPATLADYGRVCGIVLARAHAQSPGVGFIAGYLGDSESSEVFVRAMTDWAIGYERQSFEDYKAFRAAIKSGRFSTE